MPSDVGRAGRAVSGYESVPGTLPNYSGISLEDVGAGYSNGATLPLLDLN